ncbi:MAG: carboxymuconolactone decarboxylase family protein [Beijerinckiaceae bacterium]
MDTRTPSPRLSPLPTDHDPALKDNFALTAKNLGFVPNSMLIMQRRPEIMKAFSGLLGALWGPTSTVDNGFKRLVAHMASHAAGCQYCVAHTAGGAMHFGMPEEKVAAVWEYQTSPLFSPAERAALDLAVAGASVPNCASDEMFAEMRKYWSEEQIVEIVATIATFGFLNRWNDTMGTPLEDHPLEVSERILAPKGWTPGKHAR